jgi:hypothetical protein
MQKGRYIKLCAQAKLLLACFIMALINGYGVAFGQRSIDCDTPPGGRITCETHQAAFCKVEGGQVIGVCQTPRGQTKSEMDAWVLSVIFGKGISVLELQENKSLQQIVHYGYVESGGVKLRFSVPGGSSGLRSIRTAPPTSNSVRQASRGRPRTPLTPTNPDAPFKPLAIPQSTIKPLNKEKLPDGKKKEPAIQD